MTAPQRTLASKNSIARLAYKAGRGLRFLLAVPDDPHLKTYSSSHQSSIAAVTYQSQLSLPGPNIPSRPHSEVKEQVHKLLSTSPRHNLSLPRTPVARPRLGSQTIRPDLTTLNTNTNTITTSTNVTLAYPLDSRYVRASRSRGYAQDAFVTVLNPSVVASAVGDVVPGTGAGGLGTGHEARDGASEMTAWPEVEW